MTRSIGWTPIELPVFLTPGSDFIQTIRTSDGSQWAAGTAATLVFDDPAATSWAATVAGDSLSWSVDKALVAALLDAGPVTAQIRYSDGAGVDLTWIEGLVRTGSTAGPRTVTLPVPGSSALVVLPVAGPQGPAGTGGPGGGSVLKVAGVLPDGTGNVPLTPADIGAATPADVGAEATSRAAAITAEATARANADALLQPTSAKGQAGGYAALDGGGTVPDAQLPAALARDTEVTAAVAAEATARTSAITAAIAALVNSAPGLLDTLAEIDAALNNDPNFAATMTTALAGKQPLDAELTALAALASAADQLPYFTGGGAASLATFTAFARTLVAAATAAAARTVLGLGTAATQPSTAFDAAGAAATAQAAAQGYADQYAGSAAGTAGKPLAATASIPESQVASLVTDLAAKATAAALTAETNRATAAEAKPILVPTAVKTAAYTAAANDLVRADTTAAAWTLTLPTAPPDKTIVAARVVLGTMATGSLTNILTVTAGGSDVFKVAGGAASVTLKQLDQMVVWQYIAASGVWLPVTDSLSLIQLDTRFPLLSTVTAKGDLLAGTAAAVVGRVGVGADGTVLTADSTQATGLKWAAAASNPASQTAPWASGRVYYGLPGPWASSLTGFSGAADGVMTGIPIWLPAGTLVNLGAPAAGTTVTGTLFRVGLYAVTNGLPGALIVDAGTVDAGSTNHQIKTVSVVLTAGWYVPVVVPQKNGQASVPQPKIAAVNSDTVATGFAAASLPTASSIIGAGWVSSTTIPGSGALPGTFGTASGTGQASVALLGY